jgi:hypothetical protein
MNRTTKSTYVLSLIFAITAATAMDPVAKTNALTSIFPHPTESSLYYLSSEASASMNKTLVRHHVCMRDPFIIVEIKLSLLPEQKEKTTNELLAQGMPMQQIENFFDAVATNQTLDGILPIKLFAKTQDHDLLDTFSIEEGFTNYLIKCTNNFRRQPQLSADCNGDEHVKAGLVVITKKGLEHGPSSPYAKKKFTNK